MTLFVPVSRGSVSPFSTPLSYHTLSTTASASHASVQRRVFASNVLQGQWRVGARNCLHTISERRAACPGQGNDVHSLGSLQQSASGSLSDLGQFKFRIFGKQFHQGHMLCYSYLICQTFQALPARGSLASPVKFASSQNGNFSREFTLG